jgi:hypothetical protein
MEVIEKNSFNLFPMEVVCKRIVDENGFAYGSDKDFCGSKLRIDAEDIVAHNWQKYPNYKGIDYGVKCPVCGQFIVINTEKVPEPIKKSAKKIRLG